MKKFAKKHPISLFCIATILTAVLILMLYSYNATPQWSPGLYAILIIAIIKGKSGLHAIFKRLLFRKENWKWYLVALFLPIALCSTSYLVISFIEHGKLVPLEINHTPQAYLYSLLFITIGSFGEEIGWRGFMLPQLLKKNSLIISSIIIGIFWGLWHLNLQFGIGLFIIYILMVIDFSFIMSWLYVKTKGNILASVILHTSINMCSLIFFEKIAICLSSSHSLLLLYAINTCVFAIPCAFIVRKMYKQNN